GGRDFIHKIQIDIRHVQVANGAGARTDNSSDPHTGWPPEQADEAAEPQSPDRADGKLVVALLCRYRSVSILLDHLGGVNGNASVVVQLIKGLRAFICFRLVIKDYNQHFFHDIPPLGKSNLSFEVFRMTPI